MRLFTSESVTEGHPDKICDQISDAVLDELIRADPSSRVAVETLVTTGLVHVAGEIKSSGYADIRGIVRELITEIGYTSSEMGFDGRTCGVSVSVGEQSADIDAGVSTSLEVRTNTAQDDYDVQGAGDQGIMFGYATNETAVYHPIAHWLASRMAERLAAVRRDGVLPYLRPDGKTQVTVGYEGARPVLVDTVVLSTQHSAEVSLEQLSAEVAEQVIRPVLAESGLDASGTRFLINPAGAFITGGPMGDAGLTGRKIIIDTYGGSARHGGGAFSGKDPSKVDRSAAYALRWVAKNVVAAGLADRVELQLAYAIGSAHPVGLYIESFGTAHVPEERIEAAVREVFDLRPSAIIEELDLIRPIYRKTASYGHFGREEPEFSWERTDKVDELREVARL